MGSPWVFDSDAWSMVKRYCGLDGFSSLSGSANGLLRQSTEQTLNLRQINRHVYELSNKPKVPSAIIIFFHGLQPGDSRQECVTTWTSKDGQESSLNWLLGEFPDVHILMVYNDASSEKGLDSNMVRDQLVQDVTASIKASRGDAGCPIILVGHGIGGMVLKELCVHMAMLAFLEENEQFRYFLENVRGVLCYSSPQHGADFPDTTRSDGSLFKDIYPLNARTARRGEMYRKLSRRRKWKSRGLGEVLSFKLANFRGLIVPEGSSRVDVDNYYTVNADHFNVCRPENRTSSSYCMLTDLVEQVLKEDRNIFASLDNSVDPSSNLPWVKGKQLGAGSFGTVFEAVDRNGSFFAAKEVSMNGTDKKSQEAIAQLQGEIKFLRRFKHPNIVQYMGTEMGEGKLYIFLELLPTGSLAEIYERLPLADSQISAYTRHILMGLKYLHDQNVVHRDIKCANILMDTSGICKLADFGLAKQLSNLDQIKSAKGSAQWMAPEVIDPRQLSSSPADIWSLGCSVLEMALRAPPFGQLEWQQVTWLVGHGTVPEIPKTLPESAQDFLSQCLQINPMNRPTATELLEHPFVRVGVLGRRRFREL